MKISWLHTRVYTADLMMFGIMHTISSWLGRKESGAVISRLTQPKDTGQDKWGCLEDNYRIKFYKYGK
jgi:hypothetical protein